MNQKILDSLQTLQLQVSKIEEKLDLITEKKLLKPDVKRKRDRLYSSRLRQPDYCHHVVLKEGYRMLIDRMDFRKDHLLDRLVANESITQSDHESILNIDKRKDQIRYLIIRLKKYDEKNFIDFVDALEKEKHTDIAMALRKSLETKKSEEREKCCIHCKITRFVDMADVIDPLYELGLIDDDFMEKYISPSPERLNWMDILQHLQLEQVRDNSMKIFALALQFKYKKISEHLVRYDFEDLLDCSCKKDSTIIHRYLESDDTGSLSDVSNFSAYDFQRTLVKDSNTTTFIPSLSSESGDVQHSLTLQSHTKNETVNQSRIDSKNISETDTQKYSKSKRRPRRFRSKSLQKGLPDDQKDSDIKNSGDGLLGDKYSFNQLELRVKNYEKGIRQRKKSFQDLLQEWKSKDNSSSTTTVEHNEYRQRSRRSARYKTA